ncbi:tRNA lysidine(34) synthetase TilS [uncultured Dialister sp.]|uniref:tRNA lysidine(34) synthetase TilS n=1 Tax=uncultured Dialister sp. TaxID=278064 RepID=UPI00260927BE|nr:tRNA lysidine(34) synthetase TilS [uncultured Dialister sp.]
MNKKSFQGKVLTFARSHGLWARGDSVLAAVSGGPDSLGLLLFLKEIEEAEGIHVSCCCVNHHLREAAEGETEYVRKVCRRFHIPFIRKDVDVPAARRENRGSVETVARILRFKALKEAAEEGKCSKIALAHHENDQAETILFHLLRGSGPKGMAGIQPRRDIFIRPFLAVTRKEIADFLSSFPVTPCHDETNDIPDATRNKIRLELMPRLLPFNPNLVSTLSREAAVFGDEEDFMEKEVEKEAVHFKREGTLLIFPRTRWNDLHPAMKRRIIRRAVMETAHRSPDAEGVERMKLLAEQGKEGQKTSSSGAMLEMEGSWLCFFPGNSRNGSINEGELLSFFYKNIEKEKLVNRETGIIKDNHVEKLTAGPWVLTVEKLLHPVETGRNQYLLDADGVGALTLRMAEKEDFMEPSGMTGKKRVFSILQEKGIPALLRRLWPVAADENHIYWTAFLRGSRLCRVTEETKSFLLLTLTLKDKEIESKT